MPIPSLTLHGVLPAGVHNCDFDEAQRMFGSHRETPRRAALWTKLMQYVAWIQTLGGFHAICLDGSFISDKPDPNDIDVVLEIAPVFPAQAFAALDHGTIKLNFELDVYPFIPGIGNNFKLYFQYVRQADALTRGMSDNDRKGILRISL